MLDFGAMTSEHAVYIPFVALIGLFIGYIAGARAARAEYERRRRRLKE
jgi:hypothetical protein